MRDGSDPWAIKTRAADPVFAASEPIRIPQEDPQPSRRIKPEPRRQAYLYFVQCEEGGAIKIGIAQDVFLRLSGMQSGCPFRLRLLAVVENGGHMERELHRRFAEHRISGEWFRPVPELLALVDQHRPVPINP